MLWTCHRNAPSRWLSLAAMLVVALTFAMPAATQVRPERAAKKSIVERRAEARRGAAAEDFVMRLVEMPPERRHALLDNNPRFQRLPEAQRNRILARLQQIDDMPPEEREQLVERYHLFNRLEPEKRERAREIYAEWIKVDPSRRRMMTRGVARLRAMKPEFRAQALESQPFAARFDDNERRLISEIVTLAPGRPRQ